MGAGGRIDTIEEEKSSKVLDTSCSKTDLPDLLIEEEVVGGKEGESNGIRSKLVTG